MKRKQKTALAAIFSIALLLLLSFTLLPRIVRSQALKAVQEATGRVARIDKVAFNPFTLTLTVSGFGIEGERGAPFVSIGSLRVSLGSASLFKRALILDEVTINSPSLSFARLGANSYSFSDIVELQKKQPRKESKGEFRFSINNISIHDGTIDFDDKALSGGKLHTVRKLEIALPFISNIPYLLETYTDPKLSAVIDDASFSFGGKVKPLSKSRETAVKLQFNRLDLPRYMAYSPVRLPVELASGSLTIDTEIRYKVSADIKPELDIKGLLQLDKIAINRKNGEPLVKVPLLRINASGIEVFARKFAFDAILLDGVEIFASRDRNGKWFYSSLLPSGNRPAPTKANDDRPADAKAGAGAGQTQAFFSVASLTVSNASLHFSDAVPSGGFKSSVSDFDLDMKNISNARDKKADYELSMLLDNQATLAADGTFTISPFSATAAVELSDLKLQNAWPYLAQYLTAPVKGTLAAGAYVSYNRENGLEAENGFLSIRNLSTGYGRKEGFELALFEIKGAGFSQKSNRAVVDDMRLSRGSITLSKESDGSMSLLSLLKKKSSGTTTASTSVATAKSTKIKGGRIQDSPLRVTTTVKSTKSVKPLSWSLKRFQLDRFNASFTDRSREEKPNFRLNNIQLNLTNLNGPKFTPAGLSFSSTFNRDTALKARGSLTPLPFRYKGNLSAGRLQIRDFEDYFPEALNVFVIGGSIDTAMNVDIALKDGKPVGSFKGSCGVRSFHSIDAVAEEDLLKWESLQLDRIEGSLEPVSLAIHEVALNNVYSRIVVRKDGTLNLQNLVDKPGAASPATGDKLQKPEVKQPAAATASQASPPSPKPRISIGAVTVQDGTISFTDRHLPQTFNSTFHNLGGRVSGLSSEDTRLADVDLRGNLENHSPLQITGRINPLREDLFIDLKISFKDIDLSPVTPYSGTYLGYTVEKGKLFLDLKYLIDKKQLISENKVFIDQFTFGSKIESEKATGLPVRLAVALLKDRKGEIHLDLPVTGRTDDPKFSIWGVVWQVVKNLVTKAVTSPFALLSSMMGGGQDFSSIQFAIGSSRLSAQEQQKLTALSKALADRPGLKLEIKGYVERERDAEGYRRELLEQKLRNEKFLLLAKDRLVKEGDSADSVRILPEEASRLLKAVYKKEKFPKPRNVIGLVKDLPDDEMRKLIIANTVVGEPEFQKLARERGTAVMDFLVKQGGLPAERLFQKNDDIHKSPEKEGAVRSRVEFNAIAQ